MTRTEFRKLYFFSYSLQCTSHDFEKNRKTILVEMNQSILSWEVSQPPPYAQNVSPLLSCLARSSKKPLLIMEASLKIRYFDFKERSYSISIYDSMVSCDIRD